MTTARTRGARGNAPAKALANAQAKDRPAVDPSGFFLLRTPLLPFQEILAWSEGLLGRVAAIEAPGRLGAAIAADRALLRARLLEVIARPEVRGAIFVASPSLDEGLARRERGDAGHQGESVPPALVRYFLRMAARPTPFGLFAGCTVGAVERATELSLRPLQDYARSTRLDMDYLVQLVEALVRAPGLRGRLVYRVNSSLYQAAGRIRYVETRHHGKSRRYRLAAVEPSEAIHLVLNRARQGTDLDTLAGALMGLDAEITREDATAFLDELIDNDLLVPDLASTVTGAPPLLDLVTRLRRLAESASGQATPPLAGDAGTDDAAAHPMGMVMDALERVQAALGEIDAAGLGVPASAYREAAVPLAGLPVPIDPAKLFQVDLYKPGERVTLGENVVCEALRAVDFLHAITPRSAGDPMQQFREAFVARYGEREMPLLEVLDEETGIGFAVSSAPGAEASPLLAGLMFPDAPEAGRTLWSRRHAHLYRLLSRTVAERAQVLALSDDDLEALRAEDHDPRPDAFSVSMIVSAPSAAAVDAGDFSLFVRGMEGPAGVNLLGRFCHADPVLRRHVEDHLRREERLRPDAVFAEIVHLPENRVGNVLLRPVLRGHEIPYLGASGAPPEQQIGADDLMISVVRGRVVLRSRRLAREIVPRMTTAHNFSARGLGVYRFLCSLQTEGLASALKWSWGRVLDAAPFLPRVVYGRAVLSLARWRLELPELTRLRGLEGAALFQAAQGLRDELRLPRFVSVVDGDNVLPLDLDNVLCIEAFADLVKGRAEVTLREVFPGPDALCVQGPEGGFVHEVIVPFVRRPEPRPALHAVDLRPPIDHAPRPAPARSFAPGSEWLFVKLYAGVSGVERALQGVVAEIAGKAMRAGAIDRWFFLRYADPDWHLRVRFHGPPGRVLSELGPAIHAAAAPLLQERLIWKIQLDTYEREVERYGGDAAIELAEQIFHADSEAALRILRSFTSTDGADARWRLTLRGMDMLLDDLGFDLAEKRAIVDSARAAFAAELRVGLTFERQLGAKFRTERARIEALFDGAQGAEGASPEVCNDIAPGLAALRARSPGIRNAAEQLAGLSRRGLLTRPLAVIAQSHLHMFANRMLRSAARAQELVLYDMLARVYESKRARARKHAPSAPSATHITAEVMG